MIEWVYVKESHKNEILTDLSLAKRRLQNDEIFWNFNSNYSYAKTDKFKTKAAAAAINGSKSRFFLFFFSSLFEIWTRKKEGQKRGKKMDKKKRR